jgi:hypothetical protein
VWRFPAGKYFAGIITPASTAGKPLPTQLWIMLGRSDLVDHMNGEISLLPALPAITRKAGDPYQKLE